MAELTIMTGALYDERCTACVLSSWPVCRSMWPGEVSMTATTALIDAAELLPRLIRMRELLSDTLPTIPGEAADARMLLREVENMIEDILDVQESLERLAQAQEETVPWEELEARYGL